jgi:hypothetical protein
MNSPNTIEQVLEYYREKLAQQQACATLCASRWNSFAYLRGGLFFAFLIPILLGFANAWDVSTLWWILAGLGFLAFVSVALYHERIQAELTKARMLIKMHLESIARCQRDWDRIYVPEVEVPPAFAPISKDLDLLGGSSVFKLLGIARTPLGTEALKNWIIEGALADEVKRRQEAVAELRPEFEWRLRFRILCEQLAASQSGPSKFVEWSESPNWFEPGKIWVLWLARVNSLITLVAIICLIAGFLPLTVVGPTIIVVAVINFGLSVLYAGSMHDVFNLVSSRTNEAIHYVSLFDMAAEFPAKSDKLKTLQQRLQRTGDGAQRNVHRLGFLIWLANMRRNGMFFIPYMIFEFLFFWDAHTLDLLERWKQKNGHRTRDWFSDLGQWEALCALAKLAGDHPDWVFPSVTPPSSNGDVVVKGTQVGHPLLDQNRVPNDVQIGPPGTVLLVTGSNMSGKSTLLRSVGVNIVLAQMGSVVCAKALSLPPIHIETSMRIADSLADGVSFFMAELKRLKSVVDTAKAHDRDNPRRMLFLLDEILQGTNSRERQIAVSRVVRKLIDENAIGAISTHDLDLATTDELAKACQTVHFSEQFREVDGKKVMSFDYEMRSGIAETTNALKLLELVGLGEDEPDRP